MSMFHASTQVHTMTAFLSACPGLSLILERAGCGYRQKVSDSQSRTNTSESVMIYAGEFRVANDSRIASAAAHVQDGRRRADSCSAVVTRRTPGRRSRVWGRGRVTPRSCAPQLWRSCSVRTPIAAHLLGPLTTKTVSSPLRPPRTSVPRVCVPYGFEVWFWCAS